MFAYDGTPLILLGTPRVDEDMRRLFEGTLVVIAPTGALSLYLPVLKPEVASRPLIVPWEGEWDEIASEPGDDHK